MYRPYQKIDRRLTRVMNVGNVAIGGNNPIAVQTMTNTLTYDVKKTNDQISRAVKLGADLVRVLLLINTNILPALPAVTEYLRFKS